MTLLPPFRGAARREPAPARRYGRAPASPDPVTLVDLDAAHVALDPFPHYERLRRLGDVHFLPRHGFWLLIGYDAVKSAFAQPHIFSSSWRREVDSVLIAADPPHHAAARRIVSRYFSAEALARLTATAKQLAESLLKPELDAVGDYAAPIATGVAAELTGFDEAAVAEILAVPRLPFKARTRSLDRIAHRARLYETLRREGGIIGDAEARSLVRLFWLASTASTERLISYGVLYLLRDEAARRSVAANRKLLAPFVEEVVRLHPAEHMIVRRTTEATTHAGVAIPADAEVQLCLSAANRDPAYFDEPAALRLDRPAKRHLAFGGGIHHCVGAPLGRRVAAAALGTLLEHSRDLRPLEPLDSLLYWSTASELCPERLVIGL